MSFDRSQEKMRIVHVSIGLGPLDSGLTRLIASVALRLADFVSVRDQASADRAAELNPKGAVVSAL
jgi:polysaccharide pyruvyl transferase WcaK-like protein